MQNKLRSDTNNSNLLLGMDIESKELKEYIRSSIAAIKEGVEGLV